MATKNHLRVQLESKSYLLKESSPIEIRDSRFNLIRQLRQGQGALLDDGLYEISAVLEDGHKHRRLVHLQGGSKKDITLGAQEKKQEVRLTPPPAKTAFRAALGYDDKSIQISRGWKYSLLDTAHFDRDFELIAGAEPEQGLPIEFVESHGAVLREKNITSEGECSWCFEPSPNLDSVPVADFLLDGQKVTISLPVNPNGYYPLNACEVVEIKSAGVHELRAWVSRERTVVSTMQHMLASGYILHAAKIADEALELLRDKYEDPTGAVLGALILHKIGKLEYRRSWVKNLARDFDWLNDGKVLLALLLSKEEAYQEEALTLALRASDKPMMFTDSYSLLIGLLRRWPKTDRKKERHQALESLSMMSPYTNWDSIMLYQFQNAEE